jgi:steroid delta-isomerase-like uncharacterized protein
MSEETISAARGFTECYNAGDWDGLRDLMAPDAVYEEVGTGRRIEGPAAIVEVNKAWKGALPDSQGTIAEAFACDDRVVLRINWSGTQSGPLPLPTGGELAPTNREINVPACQIVRVADGKLVEAIHYFDMLTLLGQLGAISEDALAAAG